jgi:NTE family protein
MEHYDTGFALSGGFIRGFAHLGVLQALFEHNIKPEIIAGVSAGSLAGVFTADGYEPYETLNCFSHINFLDLTRPAWSRTGGLMKLDLLIDFLREHIRAKNLEELKIPMIVTATDFCHGKSVHFRSGNIAERVAASCCLPPLFSAINIDGVDYVDGGVFMNLPVAPLREICERVVAVNVSPLHRAEFKKNVISVAIRAFHFMSGSNSLWARHNADLLIEPDNLYEYGNTELDKAEDIFERGYDAASEVLKNKEL